MGVASAHWHTCDKHLIDLLSFFTQAENCTVSCDQPVTNSWRVEMVVACSHLIQVLWVWDVCCERFHFVAIDHLVVGLVVTSQSHVMWQLFDVEVLLVTFWCN